MTSRALAWRTVTAKPARAILAVVGVTVIGALLFDMLLLSRGLLISFRDLLERTGYDVRVVHTDALPTLRVPIPRATPLVSAIAKLPEVQEVALVRRDRLTVLTTDQAATVTVIAVSEGGERRAWRLLTGAGLGVDRPGADRPPLVVSERFATALRVTTGSMVRLRAALREPLAVAPPLTFEVVGVARFELEPDDSPLAATTMAAFERVQAKGARDDADIVLAVSRAEFGAKAAAAAISELRPDVRAYSNEQIVAEFNQNGFAYFRQISFVLSSITLAFAFLLIASLLSVSVNQRLHEVAALRALGFPRRRIAATLIWESAWLVGVGGVASLPIGGVLAIGLDRILRSMPGFPDRLHFFVFAPSLVAAHLALLAMTALGAAVYPVWVATRLPIASTLRRETLS